MMSRRSVRASSGLCLAAAVLTHVAFVVAQEESPARSLFKQGRALVGEGKYAEACPKFEESLRLEVGVGTQFNLADCWEHIGKTAGAQKLFLGAAASAKAAGQADREQVLRERAAALEPRVSKLVIEVSDASPKLTVKRDQLPLEPEQLGRALPMDPGKYEIVAKAPGKKTWSKTVEITAGTPVVTVEIPVLEAEPKPEPVEPKRQPEAKPATKAVASPAAPSPPRSSLNYRALGLGALGVVSLGVGTYYGLRYSRNNDDAKKICPASTNCTIAEITKHDQLVARASTSRSLMYAGVGVGTVAVAGAVALYVLGVQPEPEQNRAWVRALPHVGQNGEIGGSVAGAF
jgi:hypothetical protein